MSGLSRRGLNRSLSRSLGGSLAMNASGAAWSPLTLFAASEKGGWYDPSDLSSMFQDSAGTTPAVVDSPVGRINDKSGNTFHLTQGTTANKPTLRLASGKYYLEFDGVDDSLTFATFNLSTTDKVAICAGVRKLSDAATGTLVDLGDGTSVGTISMRAPRTAAAVNYGFTGRGDNVTGNSAFVATTFTAPITNVVYCQYDLAGANRAAEIVPRVNAATPTLATAGQADLGAGNFSNAVLSVGRNTTFNPLNGYLFGMTIIGRTLTGTERDALETYTNTKTGAY